MKKNLRKSKQSQNIEIMRSFTLSNSPLFRAYLFRLFGPLICISETVAVAVVENDKKKLKKHKQIINSPYFVIELLKIMRYTRNRDKAQMLLTRNLL